MAGAAARLGISRPAIAKRIRNLERMVGQALLRRSGRGVSLTEAGATVLAGARRLLDERESLNEALARIRTGAGTGSGGIRKLLGPSSALARAALQPETRLLEAEQLIELVLHASTTGIAISDAEQLELHVANDAFCRLLGRSRDELLSGDSRNEPAWVDNAERAAIVSRARSDGAVDQARIRVREPDGSARTGSASVRFITLGGEPKLLWFVEDETVPSAVAASAVAAASDAHIGTPAPGAS